jgi:hypothetical protein
VFFLRVYLLALELLTVKPANNFVAEKCGESWWRIGNGTVCIPQIPETSFGTSILLDFFIES